MLQCASAPRLPSRKNAIQPAICIASALSATAIVTRAAIAPTASTARSARRPPPCQLRNRRISQKADDACAKDHRLGAHNPFGADKQADPAIEEKFASQESECEQRQRGKRLEGLSIDREHGAPCCANDWTCNRFYQCLCAAPVKSCKRPAFAAHGWGRGPHVGRRLVALNWLSLLFDCFAH